MRLYNIDTNNIIIIKKKKLKYLSLLLLLLIIFFLYMETCKNVITCQKIIFFWKKIDQNSDIDKTMNRKIIKIRKKTYGKWIKNRQNNANSEFQGVINILHCSK